MHENEKSHPDWVKVRYKPSRTIDAVEAFLSENRVNTVCSSALCPNRGECFNDKAMTFLLLGPRCTRACKFCSVDKSPGEPYSEFERDSQSILLAVEKFGLRYVTLTSPTRDDMPDGGASVFSDLICKLKNLNNPPYVEALIPDFLGNRKSLEKIAESNPDVIAHNLETVQRLYYRARSGADWERSLDVLRYVSESTNAVTKSALVVGLGETDEELVDAMDQAFKAGCEVMVLGQYLRPTKAQMEIDRYVTPEQFEKLKRAGEDTGIKAVIAGPLCRSSYRAEETFLMIRDRK